MSKSKIKPIESLNYEEAYGELEQVVEQLETGTLPLEQALGLFERGQNLSKHCSVLLEEAELKVTPANRRPQRGAARIRSRNRG